MSDSGIGAQTAPAQPEAQTGSAGERHGTQKMERPRRTNPDVGQSSARMCKCGARIESWMRYCDVCGTAITAHLSTAVAPVAVEPPGAEPAKVERQKPEPARVKPAGAETAEFVPRRSYMEFPSIPKKTNAKLIIWIAIGIALMAALGGGTYYLLTRNKGAAPSSKEAEQPKSPPVVFPEGSAESKLDKAIAENRLLEPAGDSAYDLYHQLKNSGASGETLAYFNEKLLPAVTAKPQQMLADFAVPDGRDWPKKDWEEAKRLMEWATEIKPGDNAIGARSTYFAGRVAYLNNRKDETIKLYKQAHDLDTAWATPANGLGVIYNERRQFQSARQFLEEATRREPSWALPYYNLARTYHYENNIEQAAANYRLAAERAPVWARPHAQLGDIAYSRGDYAGAASEYQAAVNLSSPTSRDLAALKQKLARAKQLSR